MVYHASSLQFVFTRSLRTIFLYSLDYSSSSHHKAFKAPVLDSTASHFMSLKFPIIVWSARGRGKGRGDRVLAECVRRHGRESMLGRWSWRWKEVFEAVILLVYACIFCGFYTLSIFPFPGRLLCIVPLTTR